MKKLILIFLISTSLIGCSSIDYSKLTMPSNPIDTEIERILALDLSYADSIIEAEKNYNPILVTSVVKALNKRKEVADKAIIEAEIIAEYAEKIKVLDNNSKFVGPTISDTKSKNLMGKAETLDYFLLGFKGKNNGSLEHKLNVSITFNSDAKRNYSSVNFCDKWSNCDANLVEANLISSKASGCSSYNCDYNEVIELDLSDNFLRENMEKGLSINLNSQALQSNKITIPSYYIKGYLKVAN